MEKTEREKMYQIALDIWDKLTDVKKNPDNLLESKESPMHPYFFFDLSNVRGFNAKNGNTYEDYISKWRNRF